MSQKPRKKWEKGIPLRDAFIDFYGFPNHENDKDAKQIRFNYFVLGQDAEPGEYDAYDPETYRFSPKHKQHRLKSQNDFRNMLCISFAKQLMVGNLIAIGIRINFEGNREYVEIPFEQIKIPKIDNSDELTAADINSGGIRKIGISWDSDIFYGITDKYENVRIYDPRYNLDGTENKKYFPEKYAEKEKQYSDKPGQPSKQKVIISAFKKLKLENRINFNGTQIEAVKLIRGYIKSELPEDWGKRGSGFSEKAIGNHIREEFNAEKAKAKSKIKNI